MEPHSLVDEIRRLNHVEKHVIDRFIHRERVARDITAQPKTLGERVADRVAAFGGSWRFIGLAVLGIAAWLLVNTLRAQPFDPYPFILLNLALSCIAALQAPVIMMSQNRQSAHDRADAQHDYEVNVRAELEIVALHAKLDEIREQKWLELMQVQQRQLELLARLAEER